MVRIFAISGQIGTAHVGSQSCTLWSGMERKRDQIQSASREQVGSALVVRSIYRCGQKTCPTATQCGQVPAHEIRFGLISWAGSCPRGQQPDLEIRFFLPVESRSNLTTRAEICDHMGQPAFFCCQMHPADHTSTINF